MTTGVITAKEQAPRLPDEVWCGWLGDFRQWVEPTTDGALESIFAVGSCTLGLAIGRTAHVHLGRPTFANNYLITVGASGVSRKTTVVSRARPILADLLADGAMRLTVSIGSGEGLLEFFCDEVIEGTGKSAQRVLKPVPGRRVLLDEPEFMNLLKKARRPGTANLIEILLGLYDGIDFSPRTRARPITVTEPFFSIVTTTTPEALEIGLQTEDIDCGLLPRFATFYCTPRPPLAWPPPPDESERLRLVESLKDIVLHAKAVGQRGPMALTSESRALWEGVFIDIHNAMRAAGSSEGALLARVPQHIAKWALLYALQAAHVEIEEEDLSRAVLVGTYLMEVAKVLPGSAFKNGVARIEDKIAQALQKSYPAFLTASQIHQIVSGRVKAETLRRSLESLVRLGIIAEVDVEIRGRMTKAYSLE